MPRRPNRANFSRAICGIIAEPGKRKRLREQGEHSRWTPHLFPPVTRTSSPDSPFSGWTLLVALQAAVALVLFHDYIFGPKFFAFIDIGSDTFAQFVPALMHEALPGNWASAWSFNLGLGGPLPAPSNPFSLLGIVAGAQHVLDLRIWVYLVKILAGGAAFYGFVLATGARRDIALIVALSYSFCGYVMTDGQWDPSSTEFVTYALILWAIGQHANRAKVWPIPAAIAFAAYCGTFIFSVGVFLVYAFAAAMLASERPGRTFTTWLSSIVPQCATGLLLAGPVVVPLIFKLLDSPRITGAQAGFVNRAHELLTLNEPVEILIQLAALFHKNILGVGDYHAGWMNYLESPVFFVGMLPMLLIPQLWRGSRTDRKILVAGGVAFALFIALPAVRFVAYGFGLDYFRINNLWISFLLLIMFSRALTHVAEHGLHRWLLGGTAAVLAGSLLILEGEMRPYFSVPHAMKILAFLGASLLLSLALGRTLQWRQFALIALGLIAIEAATINYPSFHAQRAPVTRSMPGYDDGTSAALAFLKARDQGFYRVEKTFHSVGLCDALAQQYMGVKSYWFQGSSMVGMYTDLGLLPPNSPVKNYTNWLANFGGRFALDSLIGVKYVISRKPIDWAGFRKIHEVDGLSIFENEVALPLGVIYEQQFPRSMLLSMSLEAKDITMMNAAIVDSLRGSRPRVFDARQFTRKSDDWLADNYIEPARILQRRGMKIDSFSPGHIAGRIASAVPGVLVFSIPFAKGWSVTIDAVEQPVFKANLGMLATDISSGEHRMELRYALPGFKSGLLVGLFGLMSVCALAALGRRHPRMQPAEEQK